MRRCYDLEKLLICLERDMSDTQILCLKRKSAYREHCFLPACRQLVYRNKRTVCVQNMPCESGCKQRAGIFIPVDQVNVACVRKRSERDFEYGCSQTCPGYLSSPMQRPQQRDSYLSICKAYGGAHCQRDEIAKERIESGKNTGTQPDDVALGI